MDDIDFELIDETPIRVPNKIVNMDIKIIIIIVFTGSYQKSKINNLTIILKGISVNCINKPPIRADAMKPIMHPTIIELPKFDIPSYKATKVTYFFGNPIALNLL